MLKLKYEGDDEEDSEVEEAEKSKQTDPTGPKVLQSLYGRREHPRIIVPGQNRWPGVN